MKKLISIFLAALLALSLAACGAPQQSAGSDSLGQEIYNGNGIQVIAQYMDYDSSIFGPQLFLLIRNQTSRPIAVQCRDASIDGHMVDTIMSVDVSAGEQTVGPLTILDTSLAQIGVSQIKELDFSLHICDGDVFYTIVDTDPIHLTF